MHISREHGFVYVAIPRTASKSMYRWLEENFGKKCPFVGGTPPHMFEQGHSPHGHHHETKIPEEFRGGCVFTVVRNPYARRASEHFAIYDNGSFSKTTKNFSRRLNGTSIHSFGGYNLRPQSWFLREARPILVLYYERLPDCLKALPFWRPGLSAYPRVRERRATTDLPQVRPFFEWATDEDEQAVWDFDREDFERLGYERFSGDLPADLPDAFEVAW